MEGLELVSNCSNHSLATLKIYNLVWSISGLVMAVVTLAVLVLLLALKTFSSPLQRLFLYLTTFTLLDLTNNSLNLILQPSLFHQTVCRAVGYADVCIFITSLLLVSGIGLYLLFVIYHRIQGKTLPKISKFKMAVLEISYLLAVVAIPPVALYKKWNLFGISGPLCWIKSYNTNTCAETDASGFELNILATYTTLMSINICIFFILKTISFLVACRYKHMRTHHMHMAKRGSLLILFLMISFVINIAALWGHRGGVDSEIPYFTLLLIVVILVPASPVIIPLGFLIYLNSTKSLKLKTIKKAAKNWLRQLSGGQSGKELLLPHEGSVSSPANAFSANTVSREVDYTGAFTDIPSTYGSIDQTRYSE